MLSPEEIRSLRERHYNATVTYLRKHHEDLMILRVRPDEGVPVFEAGQYTTLGLGYWEPRVEGVAEEQLTEAEERKLIRRAYSISCSIWNDGELLDYRHADYLEFYIVLVREADGRVPALTPRLFALKEGNRLFCGTKVTGHYTLTGVQPDDRVLFLATGTGEAPHNTMIVELLRRGHRGPIGSAVCVRYRRDLAYLEAHRRLERYWPKYRYITLTTREPENIGKKKYIQDVLRTGELEAELGWELDPSCTHVFLCGNPAMIGAPKKSGTGSWVFPQPTGTVELLVQRGFKIHQPKDPGNVHYEEFW
jgi:ferredoxin--NADP+ reductase